MSDDDLKITIKEHDIDFRIEEIDIEQLKYFSKNPRIGSIIFNEKKMSDGELQEFIHDKMRSESSVTTLLKTIPEQGGLIEEIFIRYDTKEVIEGNSRLAAYRILAERFPNEPNWQKIRCKVVSSLDDSLQRSYLNELHANGRTKWKTYEQAYWVYNSIVNEGCSLEQFNRDTGVTPAEIHKRIRTIELMLENKDKNRENFSFYNVIIRKAEIKEEFENKDNLKYKLYQEIIRQEKSRSFTALNLRDHMPAIIDSKMVYKKYLSEEITFHEAKQAVLDDQIKRIIDSAKEKLNTIEKEQVKKLAKNEVAGAQISLRKLKKATDRVEKMLDDLSELLKAN